MTNDVARKQLRSFGLMVGGIFGVIGLWPAVFRSEDPRLWALGIAGLLIVPALGFPTGLRLPYRVWMTFGAGLGWINTRLLLGMVFYGLFTPIGLFMRLNGKDPMRRRWEPAADTYRLISQPRSRSHMTRQF